MILTRAIYISTFSLPYVLACVYMSAVICVSVILPFTWTFNLERKNNLIEKSIVSSYEHHKNHRSPIVYKQ